MRVAVSVGEVFGGLLRGGVTALLCVLLVEQPVMAGATVVKRGPTAGGGSQVQGDARILHALNRLTFGPRPGDLAAVKAMGLSTWFDLQLNPSKIDDSALEAKLASFPAMQMPQSELIARYPSQQMIRQMTQRNAGLPTDPIERAVYADQMEFYKVQQAKQAALKDAASVGGGMATPDGVTPTKKPAADMAGSTDGMAAATDPMVAATLPKAAISDGPPAPQEHVEALFKDLEAVKILNLSPDERMRKVLAMTPADFVSFRQSLSGDEVGQFGQGLNAQQREIFAAMQNSTRMVSTEVLQSRMLRDVSSDRQLQAVMTDFWLNHFNVYIRKNGNEPYFLPAYERETIRPNALGRFEDLLVATAKSPAMLTYLDNAQSVGPNSKAAVQGPRFAQLAKNPQVRAALKDRGLNENYGRELMELHTLGVNGGYTQADVTQVAKVFTGWTTDQPARGGMFQYDERRHEPGPKTVLGVTIQENGQNEGLQVLHMLATSPATARFISTKLAVRFVSDDPAPALVDRMTKAYLASDGEIKSVLRAMFESPEFWAPSVERAKVKTPEEFVISAVRASGATVNNAQGLVGALDRLGMPFYGMQTPNGYSWTSEGWVSTGALVNRMNFALVMAGDKLGGTRTDWIKLLAAPMPAMTAKTVGMVNSTAAADVDPEVASKERKLELVLLGAPVSQRTRATVIAQSGDSTAALQAAREFQGGGGAGAAGGLGLPGMDYNPALPAALTGAPGPRGPYGQKNGIPDDRQAAIMAGLLLGSPEFQRR